MAHKKHNGVVLVDWETGDKEGDRRHLFEAYSDFINELKSLNNEDVDLLIKKWSISTNREIDGFPRIFISRPK